MVNGAKPRCKGDLWLEGEINVTETKERLELKQWDTWRKNFYIKLLLKTLSKE